MDKATIGYASYRWHHICNPISFPQLERTLAFADLRAGDTACDLGCGNGVVTAWLAERYGLDITGVERFEQVAELARERAKALHAQGRMTVVEGSAMDHLADGSQHRLLVALGAVDLLPGRRPPAEVMAALAPSIAPGGWLLWGDPFWKAPPTPALAAVFGADTYATLAGWMAAGEAAGLAPLHAAVSTDADWEEFVWRMNASLLDWAAAAAEPDATTARLRANLLRNLYLDEGRERMGFGVYLFRKC